MDTPSCVANTIEMVQGLIEAAVQTAVLVMSFGSSATATAMGNAAKNSMKTAAKRNARRTAIKVSREEFKKELRKTYIRIAKKAVKDAVMGKVDAKKQELMEQYAMRGADGMAEAYMQKVEQQGKNPALIAVKEVDITGLVDAIDTSVSGDASANKQAAKWMNVIGTVDPTGILGAVANFVKHDHCEAVQKKLDEAENKRLTAPATQDLFCEPCYCWNKVNNHYSNCWWWKSWFGPPHQVYCTYGAGNAAVFRRPDPCPDA